jgi:bis(5'-nucleosidyl)-tetraphosphatase
MKRELSFGIIPLKKIRGVWQVLLVRHGKGHWAFPKGHAEEGERPFETATRELFEEVGLMCQEFLPFQPLEESYIFTAGGVTIKKHVTYFLAKVKGKLTLQEAEIAEARWLTLEEAPELATFKETKHLCEKVLQLLK